VFVPAIPIDEAELQQRAEAVISEHSPGATVAPITPLQGGASSITYSTTFTPTDGEPQKVVLKVAVAGLEPVRNRDVLRQARLQRALQDSAVPVPRVLGEHPGAPPEVPPFFVMVFEPGDCVEPNFVVSTSPIPADEVRDRELQAARIIGELHRIDPRDVGLADEPETTLEAEVERWQNSLAACDEDLRAGSEDVGERLAETVPAMEPTTLMHGDFRVGNTLSLGHEIVSVIDWELWARGDPRVDLAWFLMMANPDDSIGRVIADGKPPTEELIDTYQQSRGTSVADLDWFAALVRYKQAAAGAFIARNARRRGQESASAAGNPALLASARQLLGVG
jgi:aminoglycoside phosphotransferase (APT) family kinase protein